MLKKIKIIIIVIALLFTNVFGSAFVAVPVFTALNIGNGAISSINMVKQCSQIAMMPSKFLDMCVLIEKEITGFGFSNTNKLFISKQIYEEGINFILFVNSRTNNIIKYVSFYGIKIVNNCLKEKINLMMFLIMLSFIIGYLGLLTAKNKGNNIITYMNSMKLCPIL
jgi:hypothetical protein